jgi:hypothetical protein
VPHPSREQLADAIVCAVKSINASPAKHLRPIFQTYYAGRDGVWANSRYHRLVASKGRQIDA